MVAPSVGGSAPQGFGQVRGEGAPVTTRDAESPTSVVHLSAPVAVPASASFAAANAVVSSTITAAAAPVRSRLQHNTFIKEATAQGFPCVKFPTNTYFNGNNRTFGVNKAGSKTRLDANIDWLTRTVTQSKTTGTTILYNNGTVRDRKNAGTLEYDLYVWEAPTSTSATVHAEHNATNPFCATTGGAISYDWTATIYRDNRLFMTGSHRPVPEHEMYMTNFVNPEWTLVQRFNQGFHCLIPGVCSRLSI